MLSTWVTWCGYVGTPEEYQPTIDGLPIIYCLNKKFVELISSN